MIQDLTHDLAAEVARGLSSRDRTEVLALQPEASTDEMALEVWADAILRVPEELRTAWAVTIKGKPVVMGGVVRHPHLPHLATTWAVGTERKFEAGVQIMRAALNAHRTWQKRGVRKFQCTCLDSPELSSHWLVRLGYIIEGIFPDLGRNGETFKVWGHNHGR